MRVFAALLLASCTTQPNPPAADPLVDSGPDDSGPDDSGPELIDADGDGVYAGEDCNDADPSVFPGAEEACNVADDDCDGELDEGLLTESWRFGSEYPYTRTYSAYDLDGNLVRYGVDAAGDGALDYLSTYVWENGHTVSGTYDQGADGTIERSGVTTWDAWGDWEYTGTDDDGDGVMDSGQRWTRVRNDAGTILYSEFDIEDDGDADRITVNELDAEGRIVMGSYDSDGDGSFDDVLHFEWDPAGNLLVEAADYYADGSVDATTTWTFDAGGNMTSQTEWFVGTNHLPDTFWDPYMIYPEEAETTGWLWGYDADGYLVSLRAFVGEDAVVTWLETYTWSADHLEVIRAIEDIEDGTRTRCERTAWDALGHQVFRADDATCEGKYINVSEVTWQDDRLVRVVVSATSYPYTLDYTYDALGREVLQATDGGSDGDVEETLTHTWSCWE